MCLLRDHIILNPLYSKGRITTNCNNTSIIWVLLGWITLLGWSGFSCMTEEFCSVCLLHAWARAAAASFPTCDDLDMTGCSRKELVDG